MKPQINIDGKISVSHPEEIKWVILAPERSSHVYVALYYTKHFRFSGPRFWGKKEPFLFENASNLTHEFLYDNFNKKN